ncbi:lysosomal aspartic protease-like [Amblyomma americanum]
MGKDNLQLDGGPTAKNTYIMEADSISPVGSVPDPFYGVPFDGVLGLDHESFSMLAHLIKNGQIAEPLLAFYFCHEGGEALFGDVDDRRYSGSLSFSEVQGRNWQFNLQGIQTGDTEHICFGGCPARTAPADPFIGGPAREIERINGILGAKKTADGVHVVDCRIVRSLPNIAFTIGGKEFVLKASDYVVEVETSTGVQCHSGFVAAPRLLNATWHLGHAFLRSVYTVLEAPPKLGAGLGRVGFAYSRC